MEPPPLDILYRDAHYVVVSKPPGLLVHRTPVDREARHFALQMVRDQVGCYVYAVNRLDRGTSGVLVFALSPEAAGRLGTAFAERDVRKTYLAVVRGHPPEEEVVDQPLKRRRHSRRDRRNAAHRPAREAVTAFRRLAKVELPVAVGPYPVSWYALVEVEPQTGRKHQIRRHLRRIDHPIIGDRLHGDRAHNRFFAEEFGAARMLLHAAELSFEHPYTQQALTCSAPLDAAFAGVLDRLGWTDAMPERWLPVVPPEAPAAADQAAASPPRSSSK